jgi:predicted dehydrogenase
MRVATIGSDAVLARRRDVLRVVPGIEYAGEIGPALTERLEKIDVLFIGTPRADRFRIGDEALRSGVHVFIEWPAATSIIECAALVRLAEEAGLECGVSRPLRYNRRFESLGEDPRARLISLTMREERGWAAEFAAGGPSPPTYAMADAVDLSCALAGTSSVRRVDAERVRDESTTSEATAFSLRFHSGAYAQVLIRSDGSAAPPSIYAAGDGVHVHGDIDEKGEGVRLETVAFLRAVMEERPVPVSALDALQTMRIVERLLAVLR